MFFFYCWNGIDHFVAFPGAVFFLVNCLVAFEQEVVKEPGVAALLAQGGILFLGGFHSESEAFVDEHRLLRQLSLITAYL